MNKDQARLEALRRLDTVLAHPDSAPPLLRPADLERPRAEFTAIEAALRDLRGEMQAQVVKLERKLARPKARYKKGALVTLASGGADGPLAMLRRRREDGYFPDFDVADRDIVWRVTGVTWTAAGGGWRYDLVIHTIPTGRHFGEPGLGYSVTADELALEEPSEAALAAARASRGEAGAAPDGVTR